ncbi:DUF1394-domain-containing protein [Rozella allomycis CSF55]|uniref:DUF1394-domain-containing protein n=1 Tax=Rozella allomycis (strain CSF55) TaxID=988480 RepID=A0A4P9YRI4_ROZAC|nr:DUF1394-domain-containing protein [Rozella allomycis CSF55]
MVWLICFFLLLSKVFSFGNITVTNPIGGNYTTGSTILIQWETTGEVTSQLNIDLINRDNLMNVPVSVVRSISTSLNSYEMTVPTNLETSSFYRLYIWGTVAGKTEAAFSTYSEYFIITNTGSEPLKQFKILSPTPDTTWEVCRNVTISWDYPRVPQMPANLAVHIYQNGGNSAVYTVTRSVEAKVQGITFQVPSTVTPSDSKIYLVSIFTQYNPPSSQPGYTEQFGGNSQLFKIVANSNGTNTCLPPATNNPISKISPNSRTSNGVQPNDDERELHKKVNAMLKQSDSIIDLIKSYKGCSEEIRSAISSPTKENEKKAWESLLPSVLTLKQAYEFSIVIHEVLLMLMKHLGAGEPLKNLETNKALSATMAKMSNPNIQNDFSYYRRTLSKLRSNSGDMNMSSAIVKGELADKMSLFYAYPTPMLQATISAFSLYFTKDHIVSSSVTYCLSLMSSICLNNISKKRIVIEDQVILCLHIKNVLKIIENEGGNHSNALINALKYSTKHLNDDSTPKNIKQMFE